MINLHLTIAEVNLVLRGLFQLPYSQVHQLIANVMHQAQQQAQAGGPDIDLRLDINDVNLVLQGLSMLPYSESGPLIQKIIRQAQQQVGEEALVIPDHTDAG